ncbi:MAG TPA: hypothetical protein VFD32_12645 [Dehalococcoidia bacterium]|nr:hypothetical protein [Dehalococcoidia bacterium]
MSIDTTSQHEQSLRRCPTCETPIGHTTEFRRRQALTLLAVAFTIGLTLGFTAGTLVWRLAR